ncbi:hypothetical protein ACRALDRAFT_1071848 [Sodiomyces alcalophilus JCM 7366]|uniref:uncharacterized protein n=1 Tax=Sodiomyces alcalophilus JCM 7366 TaxID=591952 RepID=UPI0039B5F8DC
MPPRPRRSAAVKAHEAISDWADRDRHRGMSTRPRRSEGRPSVTSVTRDPPSTPGNTRHLSLTVKVPSDKLREATSGTGRSTNAGEIVAARRNRGAQKNYVVDDSEESDMSEPDEEDEEMDLEEEDAEGEEDDMDIDADGDEEEDDNDDAEGEEDADGDVDMEPTPSRHTTIKLHNPNAAKPTIRRPAAARVVEEDDEDEEDGDEELSEIEVSDPENVLERSINVGGASAGKATAGDAEDEEDAEGEEEDAEGEEDDMELADATGRADVGRNEVDELDSDEDTGSRDQTPDLSKMTRRQRARFEDVPQEYMKLSDEVQVKKHFTAEELSMRRAEMARRRRNLSDKRNEEVKMETINKLLKKQAPKTKSKAQAGGDETPGEEASRPDAIMVRWVSNKDGVRVGVSEEILEGPAGKVFVGGLPPGKMVQEVE